jgi:hypothetical protein
MPGKSFLQEVLDEYGYTARGYELSDPHSDESCIICPCGDEIEQDGMCSEGHLSPLKQEGLI